MSIEKAIEALTTAVQENTNVQGEILALLKAGKKADPAPKAEAADESPRASRRARSEEKSDSPAETADESPRRRRTEEAETKTEADPPKEETRRRPRREKAEPAEKKYKLDDVRAKFAAFIETDDEKEEEDRRDFLDAILDHLDVDKTSEIEQADFARVIGWVEAYEAGDDVRFN